MRSSLNQTLKNLKIGVTLITQEFTNTIFTSIIKELLRNSLKVKKPDLSYIIFDQEWTCLRHTNVVKKTAHGRKILNFKMQIFRKKSFKNIIKIKNIYSARLLQIT